MKLTLEQVAALCHEVNRQYCIAIGDFSQQPWESAPSWQRDSALDGVKFRVDNPDAPPSASHTNWMAMKLADGWKHGAVKNAEAKEHPCMVSFADLPPEQRAKDCIFACVVMSVRECDLVEGAEPRFGGVPL